MSAALLQGSLNTAIPDKNIDGTLFLVNRQHRITEDYVPDVRKTQVPGMADVVMQGLGLCVALIGLKGALATDNILLMILSVVLGGVLGSLIGIDRRLNQLGLYAQRKLVRNDNGENTFATAFVTASLVFCVGAMTLLISLTGTVVGFLIGLLVAILRTIPVTRRMSTPVKGLKHAGRNCGKISGGCGNLGRAEGSVA